MQYFLACTCVCGVYCLFERAFKVEENGLFVSGISFFVLEISCFY